MTDPDKAERRREQIRQGQRKNRQTHRDAGDIAVTIWVPAALVDAVKAAVKAMIEGAA